MRFVTRARPKIDRIACPWLVRRFVDPAAEFHFVAPDRVLAAAAELHALPFDVPGVELSHSGACCSFDAFLARFGLRGRGLERLAAIVRAADTGRLGDAPEAAGLLAVSLGLARRIADDHALLEAALPLYDGLLAWCEAESTETHSWPPTP